MRSAKRAILQHNGVARSEQLWLFRLGSALLWRCVATGEVGDQQAWTLALGVLVQAVLSREERRSEVQRLLHEVKGCRPSSTCAATNRRPLPPHCCSVPPLKRKEEPLRSDAIRRQTGALTRWEAVQLYNTSERYEQDCRMEKSTSLTKPFVRRQGGDRVSLFRSAYQASPWCHSLSSELQTGQRILHIDPTGAIMTSDDVGLSPV